jgi:DNA-binding LacI/PurR family transcriptional regulator/DNA-binding transcriptional regulator YhcF (GntR family)
MPRPRKRSDPPGQAEATGLDRITRPLSLAVQVEQILRKALAEGRWAGCRLPTEIELAEQLGVSRETVRLAAETLQQEGLLVKIRRKGTFTRSPKNPLQLKPIESRHLGYLQIDYRTNQGQEEAANRAISGPMLQGAIEEAGGAGFQLVVRHTPYTQLREGFSQLYQHTPLRGVIFASYGEEKLLQRVVGLGLPVLLLDHDLVAPGINIVRDDSFADAREAILYLASLGHRRIAFANWRQADLNPWRLRGYRQGLRDAKLPRHRRWEIPTELTESGAHQAVETWLGLSPRPTALYCFNNTLARFVLEEVLRRGLRVPHDLSILGAGGEEVPGLTCLQVDWHQMGRTAVLVLLRAVANPEGHTAEHHLAPHTLRVGQTSAPLAQGH